MKYLYTGLGILLACLVLCMVSTTALDRCTTEAVSRLEQARRSGEAGSYEQAAHWIEKASEGWEKRMGFFGIILSHDQLDKVDSSFRKAQAYARNENAGEFGPTCAELIDTLQNLSETEKPHYYNVF